MAKADGNGIHRQHMDLRVVLRHEGRHALAYFATLAGSDLYYGTRDQDGRQKTRSTYHESGVMHLYVGAEPVARHRSEPLMESADWKSLGGTGCGSVAKYDWSYQPKPDSDTRQSLIVDFNALPDDGWSVAFCIVERGRDDLVDEILSGRGFADTAVVLAAIDIRSTQPILVAVIWTLTDDAMESLRRSVEKRRRHK